jgi:hypothetical protein
MYVFMYVLYLYLCMYSMCIVSKSCIYTICQCSLHLGRFSKVGLVCHTQNTVWLKRDEGKSITFTARELTVITLYLYVDLKVLSREMHLAKSGLIHKVLIKGKGATSPSPHPVRAL